MQISNKGFFIGRCIIHIYILYYVYKEKEMATHSCILAWKISWAEEPGRATVHGVSKSRTLLSVFTFTFTSLYVYNIYIYIMCTYFVHNNNILDLSLSHNNILDLSLSILTPRVMTKWACISSFAIPRRFGEEEFIFLWRSIYLKFAISFNFTCK